jgi:hypothetical protein
MGIACIHNFLTASYAINTNSFKNKEINGFGEEFDFFLFVWC